MKAYSLIRDKPWYRREAFSAGLKAAGYEVLLRGPVRAEPGDVLVIWNRYGGNDSVASRFEKEGGRVLVAENGYIGRGGTAPKFDVHPAGPKPDHYYALALGGHNGQGIIPTGGSERLAALELPMKPWREDGEHILVLPNRSFGLPGRMMPPDWHQTAAKRLQARTKRSVRTRLHPGNDAPARPLEVDLEGAWAAVVWTSSAGVRALVEGVPVFCEAPFWICKDAGAGGTLDAPEMPDRIPALERMAWAQWTCAEIESGEPFVRLLSPAG